MRASFTQTSNQICRLISSYPATNNEQNTLTLETSSYACLFHIPLNASNTCTQHNPRFFLHGAPVFSCPDPQSFLNSIVEISNGYTSHVIAPTHCKCNQCNHIGLRMSRKI